MMAPKIRKKPEDGASGSESSEAIGSNEDLLTLIMLYLPVISLIRFKLVSKGWLSLITSPRFSHLKSKRFTKQISGLILSRKNRNPNSNPIYEFIPLDEGLSVTRRIQSKSPLMKLGFIPTERKLVVLQYCNGLMLCRESCEKGTFYVFNPTTKEYMIPRVRECVDKSSGEDCVLFVNFVFDPKKSLHYKIICIYLPRRCIPTVEFHFKLGIYSSETDVLKKIDSYLSQLLATDFIGGLYWNGCVNWINPDCDGIYFNVDEERLGTFPRAPVSNVEDALKCFTVYYGECNDHLHLIRTLGVMTSFDVYEMERDYSGWFVKFRVDLQSVLSSFGVSITSEYIVPYGVLGVVRKDEDVKSFLVLSIPRRIIRFEIDDGSFSQLCFASTNDGVYDWKNSIPFIGSLHRM